VFQDPPLFVGVKKKGTAAGGCGSSGVSSHGLSLQPSS
jgi:hypothetical protein